MDLLLGGGGAVAVTMGFLHREGGIGGDTSHNALKWVPGMYNSFDHFPYISYYIDMLFLLLKLLIIFLSSCVKPGKLAEGCLYMHPIIIFGLLLLAIISAQQDSTRGIVNFISALGMLLIC